MKVESSLSCTDHELVDFRILEREQRAKSKIARVYLRREDSGLFKDELERVM